MKHYHKNPRQISEKQFKQLQGWLEEFGDLSGIVHNIRTDEIIGGNQRAEAMHFIGNGAKPVIEHKYSKPTKQGTVAEGYYLYKGERFHYRQVKWNDKKSERANMIANKAGGEFDFDIMANEWELSTLLDTGWTEKELLGAGWEFEDKTQDAEPQIDRAAELLKKWKVSTGDMFQIGDHKLICGDCTDAAVVARVMGGEKATLLFTDAPYNVTYASLGSRKEEWGDIENDDMDDDEFYKWLLLVGKNIDIALSDGASIYLCHGDTDRKSIPFIDIFRDMKWKRSATIIWAKQAASMGWQDYRSQHECISYGWKNGKEHYFTEDRSQTTLWEINRDAQSSYEHPTQKPVELPIRAIQNSTKANEVVVDFFVGSGTTLVACENLHRRGRAIEISPSYVSVTLQRMFDAFPGIEIRRVK